MVKMRSTLIVAGLALLAVQSALLAQYFPPESPRPRPNPPATILPPDHQPPLVSKDDVNVITVEGKGTTEDAALKDALRTAVEKGCGQFIHSQSETKNYELILDKVLSKSAGFVKRYEPNPPKYSLPDANGVIRVTITAYVAVKEVATEWGEIQIVLQQKNKPRLMVIISERIDGQKQDDSTVASEIEKQLLKNDFPLIDKGQFTEVQRRDVSAAAFEDDLTKVIALSKQFGAEVVVVGSSQADYGTLEEVAPEVKVYMYGTTVKVRAVRTDNAATLFSENVSTRKGSRTKTGGAAAALQDAGVQLAKKVQDGLIAKWGREIAENQSVNLEVSNITFKQRSDLTVAMKKLPKVAGVQERPFSNKVAFYTVDIKCNSDDFAKLLSELKEWKLEVTEVTANAVKCKITE
ncbi:MAG: hypothetical protein PHU85_03525 [Phycisphaerae bacterium]|nr:hypothetical protein [Phycisphaerae bacterium]